MDEPYELLERMAIKEYCANLPRFQAEREAREEFVQQKACRDLFDIAGTF